MRIASSLTVNQLNGFARQNKVDPGRGTEALSTFYGWRQDIFRGGVARGLGAFAVALLLALVGASLEAGKTIKETTTGSAQPKPTTITTTESTARRRKCSH